MMQEQYYVPLGFKRKYPKYGGLGLTIEDVRMIYELPENKKCEECNKTVWVCTCNI